MNLEYKIMDYGSDYEIYKSENLVDIVNYLKDNMYEITEWVHSDWEWTRELSEVENRLQRAEKEVETLEACIRTIDALNSLDINSIENEIEEAEDLDDIDYILKDSINEALEELDCLISWWSIRVECFEIN